MTLNELYLKLKDAYSDANLNRLSLELISLYKDQKYGILRQIAEIIDEWVVIEISEDGKGFSKFMMLYHPDRGDLFRNQIEEFYKKGEFDKLMDLSHILEIRDISELTSTLNDYEDIDYSPVYEWDLADEKGYHIEEEKFDFKESRKKPPRKNCGYTFYDAYKIRIYGHTDIEFPPYYLEDFDEFEMNQSEIENLDGIEYCIHAEKVDLSDNLITDLTPLTHLKMIKELDLSYNSITIIDSLRYLHELRNLDLSHNEIDDISVLFELTNLEYVDLTGNPVPDEQLEKLKELSVEIVV